MPTNKVKINERRLDSLAKILECSSTCVAVACIDDQFVIAANEFNRSTQQSEHVKLITEIMIHFKEIVNTGNSNVDRNKLIQKICQARLSVIGKGNLRLPSEAISKFITCKRLFCVEAPQKSECDQILSNSHVFAKSSAAFADMQRIYRAFRKIENAIKKARSGNFKFISNKQLNAFKKFQDFQILRKSRKGSKVHAELQILTELILLNKSLTYVGISKLCCFNCHCLLLAANSDSTFNKDFILTRGSHLGKFDKNWDKPDFFFEWYKKNNKLTPEIVDKISEVKNLYNLNFKELEEACGYNMEAIDSSSNPSTQSSEEKLYLYNSMMEERKRVFSEIKEKDYTIQSHLELTEFCLLLNAQSIFNRFFFLTKLEEKELNKISKAFFSDLQTKIVYYDYTKLGKFLDSSYFPDIPYKDEVIKHLKEQFKIFQSKKRTHDDIKLDVSKQSKRGAYKKAKIS